MNKDRLELPRNVGPDAGNVGSHPGLASRVPAVGVANPDRFPVATRQALFAETGVISTDTAGPPMAWIFPGNRGVIEVVELPDGGKVLTCAPPRRRKRKIRRGLIIGGQVPEKGTGTYSDVNEFLRQRERKRKRKP